MMIIVPLNTIIMGAEMTITAQMITNIAPVIVILKAVITITSAEIIAIASYIDKNGPFIFLF